MDMSPNSQLATSAPQSYKGGGGSMGLIYFQSLCLRSMYLTIAQYKQLTWLAHFSWHKKAIGANWLATFSNFNILCFGNYTIDKAKLVSVSDSFWQPVYNSLIKIKVLLLTNLLNFPDTHSVGPLYCSTKKIQVIINWSKYCFIRLTRIALF